MVGLVLLVSMMEVVVSKERNRGSEPGRIADLSTYFQSFSDLYSAINIAYHVQ